MAAEVIVENAENGEALGLVGVIAVDLCGLGKVGSLRSKWRRQDHRQGEAQSDNGGQQDRPKSRLNSFSP